MKKTIKEATSLMGQNVIKRLRDAVLPVGDKINSLRELSDKHLAEVYHRLIRGQEPDRIAIVIHEKFKKLKSLKKSIICKDIKNFRKSVVGSLVPQSDDSTKDLVVKKDLYERAKSISKKVDGMELLAWIIGEQATRFELWREKENTAKIPFKATEHTVRELSSLLDKYIRLQIDLGVLDAKPSEYNLKVKHTFDGVMKHMIKGGENVMIDAANKFAELAEKSVETLEQNKEGEWELLPPPENK